MMMSESADEKSNIGENTKFLKCSAYLQALPSYPIHLRDRMTSKRKDSEHIIMSHIPHNSI